MKYNSPLCYRLYQFHSFYKILVSDLIAICKSQAKHYSKSNFPETGQSLAVCLVQKANHDFSHLFYTYDKRGLIKFECFFAFRGNRNLERYFCETGQYYNLLNLRIHNYIAKKGYGLYIFWKQLKLLLTCQISFQALKRFGGDAKQYYAFYKTGEEIQQGSLKFETLVQSLFLDYLPYSVFGQFWSSEMA